MGLQTGLGILEPEQEVGSRLYLVKRFTVYLGTTAGIIVTCPRWIARCTVSTRARSGFRARGLDPRELGRRLMRIETLLGVLEEACFRFLGCCVESITVFLTATVPLAILWITTLARLFRFKSPWNSLGGDERVWSALVQPIARNKARCIRCVPLDSSPGLLGDVFESGGNLAGLGDALE